MKKLALSSLIAVFAVSGAHAANVIDGNPLYMPKANHFYSVTSLESHSENTDAWALGEEFGYGVTDKLAITLNTNVAEDESFDVNSWNAMSFGAAFRALDMGAWKVDALGAYTVDPMWADHSEFLDKGLTRYTWTAGVRGGYATSLFTVAGHVAFDYLNTESFNWGDDGVHALRLGVDGQYVLCDKLNLVAGVEYRGVLDDVYVGPVKVKNNGTWNGMFGVNYNIDATKFVGAYVKGSLNHHEGNAADEWGWNDGFGYGVKFGIDF